jgi:hypothetical protein
MALPNWVNARSLAVYLIVINGVAAERPATYTRLGLTPSGLPQVAEAELVGARVGTPRADWAPNSTATRMGDGGYAMTAG